MNASSGSYLACCLPPNAPPGSGANTRTLASGRPDQVRDDPLQPIRVLDRAPDRDAVAIGCGHERVGLDRELRHHRERVGALGDEVRLAHRGVEIAPAVAVLAEDVRPGKRVVRPDRRILDERRPIRQRRGEGVDRRAAPRRRRGRAGRLLRRIGRLRRDRRHRLTVVLRLPDGQDRTVAPLRPEARHRLRQVGGGHHEPNPGYVQGRASVDLPDPGAGGIDRDELHVEDVVEFEVRDVLLLSRHAPDAADPGRRRADTPVIAVRRRRSGSMLDPPSPAPGRALRGPPGRRSPRPRPPRTRPR